MTRKAWTTEPQREWLEARLAAFREAQHTKTTSTTFFPQTQKSFKDDWPVEPPTNEEITDAGGSIEKATANKNKALNSRIQNWFNNHARAPTSGNGTRGVLKLKATPKMLQKWQAYHRYRQTYDATWKATVEKAWTDHKSEWEAENPGVAIPRTKHFEVMNEYIKKTFDDETPEKKQEVEDYRKKLKDEKDEGVNEDNEYQTGINLLPRTMMTIGESIMKQTGLNVSIIVGGPIPREGGRIQTYIANFGKTIAGNDFKEFLGDADYENNIMAPFDDFLHECFTPEVCQSRVCGVQGSKENSPGRDEKYLAEHEVSDSEEMRHAGPASHVINSDKQKTIISAILKQFHGRMATEGEKIDDSDENPTPDSGLGQSTHGNNVDIAKTTASHNVSVSKEKNPPVGSFGSPQHAATTNDPHSIDAAGDPLCVDKSAAMDIEGTAGISGTEVSNNVDIAKTTASHDVNVSKEKNPPVGSVGSPQHAATTNDLYSIVAAGDPVCVDKSAAMNDADSEMSAPQPLTTAVETQAPDWLSRMLEYLKGVSDSTEWQELVSALLKFENLNPPSGKLATEHRPKEMKPWIKAHVNKKDIAPKVRPEVYGKSFLKWWTSLQPNWRKMVDGTLGNDTPDDEKWGGLMKGGTSGIYTVVIALSWWIKALGTFTCGGDASVTIRDVTWVLEQASLLNLMGIVKFSKGPSELKADFAHQVL